MPSEGIAGTAQFHERTGLRCTITVADHSTRNIDVASYWMFMFAAWAAK